MILYSTDGKGTVEAKRDEGTLTCWYAAGTLVGMAVTDDKNSNGLVNCSVAGYTVNANVYTSCGGVEDHAVQPAVIDHAEQARAGGRLPLDFHILDHIVVPIVLPAEPAEQAARPEGYTVMGNELKATPGTEKNPYGVRAMGQLSAINWNSENRNTKTVLHGHSNVNMSLPLGEPSVPLAYSPGRVVPSSKFPFSPGSGLGTKLRQEWNV